MEKDMNGGPSAGMTGGSSLPRSTLFQCHYCPVNK
jgi:hypothetical protein